MLRITRIDTKVAEAVAMELKAVHDLGVEIAIVVGGGNIFSRRIGIGAVIWTVRRLITSGCWQLS